MTHKIKESEFSEPVPVQPINGFNKADMDLINNYCKKYGYHPNFKQSIIQDASKCHSVRLVKRGSNIYAQDPEHGIEEMINNNAILGSRIETTCKNRGWNKLYDKYLSDAFGLVSLKHSEGL